MLPESQGSSDPCELHSQRRAAVDSEKLRLFFFFLLRNVDASVGSGTVEGAPSI